MRSSRAAGADLFEAIPLEAPIDEHWLFISSVPHLYPLAKLVENYPRYAAVMLDTNKARIFVFGLAAPSAKKKSSAKRPAARRRAAGRRRVISAAPTTSTCIT